MARIRGKRLKANLFMEGLYITKALMFQVFKMITQLVVITQRI